MQSHCFLSASRKVPLALTLLLIGGCGTDSNLIPVSGKVMNGDQPLTSGMVTFHPDKTQGNTTEHIPMGQIGEDGTYTLYTAQKVGAPPGWYRLTVVAEEPRTPGSGEDEYAPPKYLVREDYVSVEVSPLTKEVKSGAPAGHYDITLEKKK
jgi:hypothetical protein